MGFKGTKGDWFRSGTEIVAMPSQVKITNNVSGNSYEEALANAKLMVASKTLLEALQSVIDPQTGLVADCVAHEIGSEKAYAIEQAIEKALK